jgi:hypothetical protein
MRCFRRPGDGGRGPAHATRRVQTAGTPLHPALQRNSLALIRLARSFGQPLRRTSSPHLGAAARASLILTEILFRDPNQRKRVPL